MHTDGGWRFADGGAKALLILFILAGCSGAPKPSATPARDPVAVTLYKTIKVLDRGGERFSANVTAYTQVSLNFNASGYVKSIKQLPDSGGALRWVQAGDPVREGEELASLRNVEFRANLARADAGLGQAVAGVADAQGQIHSAQANTAQSQAMAVEAAAAVVQQKANLDEAQAGIATAQAQLREAQAQLERARFDWYRSQALFRSESLTKPDYDAAKANYDVAGQKVDEARQGVAQAKSRVLATEAQIAQALAAAAQARAQIDANRAGEERAQANLASAQAQVLGARGAVEQANVQLGDISLRSPLTGVIVSRKIDIGQKVDPGTAGFEVADNRHIKAVFGVPDVQLKNLKLGQTLEIRTEALPGLSFKGRVESISPEADPQSRVYLVQVKVPNPQQKLALGMSASLDLGNEAARANPVMVPIVPVAAVQMDRMNPTGDAVLYVAVEHGGKLVADQRQVKTGAVVGDNIQILSGLDEGDMVIVEGVNQVRDGDPVKPLKE